MKPRGPLMIEHRLIEKMLKVVSKEIIRINKEREADPSFIDTAVDFIRTYADRTHHGKEEDILFNELEKKNISHEDEKMMKELVEEHKFARGVVGELVEARNKYANGHVSYLDVIVERLNTLVRFYPEHIKKEDKDFFPNTEKYFSEAELNAMLSKFLDFDRDMIHEKYKKVVDELESMQSEVL